MVRLTKAEMDAIIKRHWPRTCPSQGMYNMLQDAADLAVQSLIAEEAKQEPVASYQLSAPFPTCNCKQGQCCPICDPI